MARKDQPGFWSAENLRSMGFIIIIIMAIRSSIASPYVVPTASMEPTIKVGDRLLANKLAYSFKIPFTDFEVMNWGTPQRGDIIVFQYPRDPDIDYVKRVVGVAGDRIEIRDDILIVNGEEQKLSEYESDRSILDDIYDVKDNKLLFKEQLGEVEHWVIQDKSDYHWQDWPDTSGEPFVVPENSVFCMGDNRDNSLDSRSWNEVPLSYVRGKAMFVLWSMFTPRDEKWPEFRWDRFGHWLH